MDTTKQAWDPAFCGDIDIRIDTQGSWHYNGSPITRQPLVKLFASVLRKEQDGHFYLVTPVEKMRIHVEDAPFVIIDLRVENPGLSQHVYVRTNLDDEVCIDATHRLWTECKRTTQSRTDTHHIPYVHIRDGLNARINRSVFYTLVEQLTLQHEPGSSADDQTPDHQNQDDQTLGLWSAGNFFSLSLS